MSLDSTETETIWLAPKLKRLQASMDKNHKLKQWRIARRKTADAGDDGYLFFARELQKACAGVTIVDQVSTRINYDVVHEDRRYRQ